MKPRAMRIVPKRDGAWAVVPGALARLSDLDDDYMLADPLPDFRDWKVTLPDGRRVGTVEDILVDTSTMLAKYVEVKVDHKVLLDEEDSWVLVPVESVRIDTDNDRVVIDHLPAGGLAGAPRHNRRLPTPEEQDVILTYFEITTAGGPDG